MRTFILNILKFLTPLIFIFIIIFWCFGNPPTIHSKSISLNSKINDIKINHPKSNLDVLSFGSSMNLNNLNSEVIINNYGTKYLNISSWGQTIQETYRLMQIFTPYYKPKVVLISGNYMDFFSSDKNINYASIKNEIIDNSLKFVFSNINPFKKENRLFYLYKSSFYKNTYESLYYDHSGGVNFSELGFKISKKRWDGNQIEKPDLIQYKYLDSIAKYCNENKIRLIYIQSPFREGFVSKMSIKENKIINDHTSKLDSILNEKKIFFLNSQNMFWSDSLFVDYSHLNKMGTVHFTNFALKINK